MAGKRITLPVLRWPARDCSAMERNDDRLPNRCGCCLPAARPCPFSCGMSLSGGPHEHISECCCESLLHLCNTVPSSSRLLSRSSPLAFFSRLLRFQMTLETQRMEVEEERRKAELNKIEEEEEEDGMRGTLGMEDEPKQVMEFLSRSWSIPALELSNALFQQQHFPSVSSSCSSSSAMPSLPLTTSPFCFGSAITNQMVLDHILPCENSSPQTSGRLSQSSGSLNAHSSASVYESPPASPRTADELSKLITLQQALNSDQSRTENLLKKKFCRSYSSAKPPLKGRTVGRWLKDMKEKKKEENRMHNAQVHAAMSVAGVASAVAAVAAATAARNTTEDDQSRTSMAVASAAALVAAQCVEVAESFGVDRRHLSSVLNSAVNVRTPGDIMTLTAGAATALRGAAILRARALKDVWNSAYVMPYEKGTTQSCSNSGELHESCTETVASVQAFLARGGELLKRTRKGVLHWKMVHVYIKHGQVMLKMKSRHMGNTFTKKKKTIVYEVYREIPAWPGRDLSEEVEQRCYFGLDTARGLIQFECKNKKEHHVWTEGVSSLLSIVHHNHKTNTE